MSEHRRRGCRRYRATGTGLAHNSCLAGVGSAGAAGSARRLWPWPELADTGPLRRNVAAFVRRRDSVSSRLSWSPIPLYLWMRTNGHAPWGPLAFTAAFADSAKRNLVVDRQSAVQTGPPQVAPKRA